MEQKYACSYIQNRLDKSVLKFMMDTRDKLEPTLQNYTNQKDLLVVFLSTLLEQSLLYEQAVQQNVEQFQTNITKIYCEKQKQELQLIVNSVLHFIDHFKKHFFNISSYIQQMKKQMKNITENYNQVLEIFATNFEFLENNISQREENYNQYLQAFIDQSKLSQTMQLQDIRDRVKQSFKDNKMQIISIGQSFKEKIGYLIQKEQKINIDSKDIILNLCNQFDPQSFQITQLKNDQINEQYPEYKLLFKDIEQENFFFFESGLNYRNISVPFLTAQQFFQFDKIISNSFYQSCFDMLLTYQNQIPTKTKLFFSLILHQLYAIDVELPDHIFKEINHAFDKQKNRFYFICSLMLQKTFEKTLQNKVNVVIKNNCFQNIRKIFEIFFNKEEGDAYNQQLLYNILNFGEEILNLNKKQLLIEHYKEQRVFLSSTFWSSMYDFVKKQVVQFQNKNGQKKKIDYFSDIFLTIRKQNKNQDNKNYCEEAFNVTIQFLFKMKFDFDILSELIIKICQKRDIDFQIAKQSFSKNESLFVNQIVQQQQKNFYKEHLQQEQVDKSKKLTTLFLHSVLFIDNLQHIIQLTTLNKQIFTYKRKFLKKILAVKHINSKLIRSSIINQLIPKETYIPNLKKKIEMTKKNKTIMLDLKRTQFKDKEKDIQKVSLILYNIEDPSCGNFEYYQGLNYIVCYFFLFYDGNPVKTYNTTLYLMQKYFSSYLSKSLKNLHELFFYIKQYIELYFPKLSFYLKNEVKVEIEIIFAPWCLTLFTTATQFPPYSHLLDQIIDIFISKGWLGFIQVVLVIMRQYQDDIMQKNYEEILMMLSQVPRIGLKQLQENGVDFKTQIKLYKKVNKIQQAFFNVKYREINEELEKFWIKLNQKLKKSKNN